MKHGATGHWKMYELAIRLEREIPFAIGIMECLWHATSQYAPDGGIGKMPDSAIARELGWRDEPEKLIEALVGVGFLERREPCRLFVHDWPEHCQDNVHRALAQEAELFADGSRPKTSKIARDRRDEVEKKLDEAERSYREQGVDAPPLQAPDTTSDSGIDLAPNRVHNVMARQIMNVYPKTGRPGQASDAITAAITRIARNEEDAPADWSGADWPPENPGSWLFNRTEQFAKAINGADRKYIPTAGSWFSQQGYLQHPDEWRDQHAPRSGNGGVERTAQKILEGIIEGKIVGINGAKLFSKGEDEAPEDEDGLAIRFRKDGVITRDGEVWLDQAAIKEAEIEFA